jgi:hypothetical protein
MEILNAADLTGSYRAAAELCGCSHHTVKKAVEDRNAGLPPATRRARMIDGWRDVLEGWVGDSKGKIRGDKAHERLVQLGCTGTDRTTRRALAEIKAQWRLDNTRVHRRWITEPGLWLQYDFGDGPIVDGGKVVLLVAWLAWCRYRIVIALRDRTAPSVFAGLDRIFRILGGAPTYLLTDNEKTVTTGHIAGRLSRPSGSLPRHGQIAWFRWAHEVGRGDAVTAVGPETIAGVSKPPKSSLPTASRMSAGQSQSR